MPGKGDDGRGGHQHGRVRRQHDDLGAGEGARPQLAVGIGHFGFHHQGAVVLGDRRADAGHPPGVLARIAFDRQINALAHLDAGRVALGHGEPQPQGVHLHQHGDGSAHGHIVAGVRQPFADRAVEGRGEHRVGQLLLGEAELGAALAEDGLAGAGLFDSLLIAAVGHTEGRFGGVQVGTGNELLVEEPLHALESELGLLQGRRGLAHTGRLLGRNDGVGPFRRQAQADAGLHHGGLGLGHPQLEIGGHQPGDRLTAPHRRADVDEDLVEAAGHLEAQRRLLIGGQGPGDVDRARQPADLGFHDPHLASLAARGFRGLLRRGRGIAAAAGHQGRPSRG